ncbi:MAG: dihydropyrimidinase [Arenicellales bacterium]
MKDFDLLIRGGTVATAADTFRSDIGIRKGRVAALGRDLAGADTVIDAVGLVVTPGGVDSHCHMDQPPWEGQQTADDFESGTVSAACGGTTTVIPFAMQIQGQSLNAAVEDYHARAGPKAVIDYAFHMIVSDPTPQVLEEELPDLIRRGYTSLKIYLTFEGLALDDYQVLEVLDVARREQAMVMVHAENDACIRWLTRRLLAAGKRALKHHLDAHPAVGEREATHRAISFAELLEVPILITHVSHRESAGQVRWAQTRGLEIYGETCPQYLFLSAEDIDTPDLAGAKCVCTPPPRDKANQVHIWRGLENGTFQVFSSDHSPYLYTEKTKGGPDTPFSRVPNGVPGIETRMPLLFSEGVGKGRLSLQQFVALTATNAAKIYGLYPRKGTIAVGADADFAIWDPRKEVVISNDILHHATDYTPYEGMRVTGWPVITVSRGEVVCREGAFLGARGRGRFLPCAPRSAPRP